MDTGDDIKPTISLVDLQRGCKTIEVRVKTGDAFKVTVKAASWEQLAEIHVTHGTDTAKIERALIEASLPPEITNFPNQPGVRTFAWLDWLDMESRNHVQRVVREFAYGFETEKKRTLAVREISKLLSARKQTPPSNAPATDSATPSPGADPNSDGSLNGFAELKPTTA